MWKKVLIKELQNGAEKVLESAYLIVDIFDEYLRPIISKKREKDREIWKTMLT